MDIQKLTDAGFVEVQSAPHNIYYQKRMPVREMPYAAEHIIDNNIVGENDTAVIEFFPHLAVGGGVQMHVDNTDYCEEFIHADTEDGLALLRDAGVDC